MGRKEKAEKVRTTVKAIIKEHPITPELIERKCQELNTPIGIVKAVLTEYKRMNYILKVYPNYYDHE